MKKVLKNLVLILSILSIASCSKNDENTSLEQSYLQRKGNRFKPVGFEFIGIQHNKIVDGIKQSLLNSQTSNNELQQYSETFIYSKVAETYNDQRDLELANTFIHSGLHKIPDYTTSLYSNLDNKDKLSKNAKLYLDNLLTIMLEDNADLEQIVQNIIKLENDAYEDSKLTNDDLLIIYPATSVAKNSITYWTDNYDVWKHLLSPTALLERGKTPGRRIGEIALADVGGAVGGALGAWAVNVWVGPGQLAYAGAIIGGAVSCSATATVYHLAASIFQWD